MLLKKIKSRMALKQELSKLDKQGKRIAFTNGCFDVLHYGHVKYLEDAKKKCDILVVAVNDDSSIKRLKGNKRPVCVLKDRMRVLAGLSSVDYVTWFREDTPFEIIGYLKPGILIKGADYKIKDIVGSDIVKRYGGTVKRIKYIKGYSVTGLIDKIKKSYSK
jgi:rfaE bifunctional protein nucleotidyltransferase chain/domain